MVNSIFFPFELFTAQNLCVNGSASVMKQNKSPLTVNIYACVSLKYNESKWPGIAPI